MKFSKKIKKTIASKIRKIYKICIYISFRALIDRQAKLPPQGLSLFSFINDLFPKTMTRDNMVINNANGLNKCVTDCRATKFKATLF